MLGNRIICRETRLKLPDLQDLPGCGAGGSVSFDNCQPAGK